MKHGQNSIALAILPERPVTAMTSTFVCRLCRELTVHFFSVIGIEHEFSPRIAAVLDIALEDDRNSDNRCH